MPLPQMNTNIPLGTQVPQIQSPLRTLGALSQLDQADALTRERQLMNQRRQQEIDDDNAIRQTLSSSKTPDDAIDTLYKNGRATAAATLSKGLFEHRKAQADSAKELVDTHQKAITFASQIAASATDQKSWDSARKAMAAVLDPVFPDMMQQVPQQYDPETQKQLVGYGTTLDERLRTQQNAIANAQKAVELQNSANANAETRAKNKIEAGKYWMGAASNLLSTATNQNDWDNYQRMLAGQGAPIELVAQFGNRFSPDAVKRAAKLGMDAKEEADVAHQKVEEGQGQQRINIEQDRLNTEKANGSGGGAGARSLTGNERAAVERWKKNKFDELEKDYRGGTNANMAGDLVLTPDTKHEMGQRKVEVENSARRQLGEPTLFEAEQQALVAGDQKKARQIRNIYRSLTMGEDTPREQLEKLSTKLKSERDPQKADALRTQIRSLASQYSGLVPQDVTVR